ncbi:MAG: SDR family oxidoreductase [Planctomycetia bacterium]|nr:SDR family oxidoreductase [Planctomycetia bacterium]
MNAFNLNSEPFHKPLTPTRENEKYVFLTGATGMLGSYFLRDLLSHGYRVVVLVRQSRNKSASQRVDALLKVWESEGFRYPRPKVIAGDLSGLGWLEEHADWCKKNVDTVIHSAASLVFYGDRDAEPYLTNLQGIHTVLRLCERAQIRKFHHISTAYVAGSKPIFYEHECNEGQEFRNDYERSKMESEQMVRDFGFESLTVYRPSIVIGDTQTGYTATFSGLYAALKLVHTLVSRLSLGSTSARFALAAMGMNGNESKNLVPVDWVAKVLMHIFSNKELHGKTYHLTNPNPPQMKDVAKTIQDVVEQYSNLVNENDELRCDEAWFGQNFMKQMKLFRAYLNEDPQFDSSNTTQAAPHLPCPVVDYNLLMFLFHKAIESQFGKNWRISASALSYQHSGDLQLSE